MNRRPNSIRGPHPTDSDSAEADDEDFPPTRFFSDAIARTNVPVKRRKRSLKMAALIAGFGLTLVALAGLVVLLTA
jgi:hypothetical protein